MLQTAPAAEASAWLASFSDALSARDIGALLDLFAEDCYWRDLVAFTWNVKTLEGKAAIRGMVEATLASTRPAGLTVRRASGQSGNIEGWFDFRTAAGSGRGIFRLEGGKCRTILTTLQSLQGHEEAAGPTRPMGVRHGADRNRRTWSELRATEEAELGTSRQPYCLIIGGGQGGIMLGARL
jgi:putative flavoprotein involved in K+ transport